MKDETKRKLFYKFSEIDARQQMGVYWIQKVDELVNPQTILVLVASLKIIFPTIPLWITFTGAVGFKLLMQFVRYFIGWFMEKSGIWAAQTRYNSNKEHMSPFFVQTKKTLIELCEKMGIKHYFEE